jgi:signal transduction histidine kinase
MAALPYGVFYLLLAIAAAALAAYAWGRRYYRSGRPLAMLMASISWWFGCRALAVSDPSFEGTLFWSLLQFAGIAMIMPIWLIVALSFTGHWLRRNLSLVALIFLPALAFVLAALTNSFHGLWWSQVQPDTRYGFMWLRAVHGPLFAAHVAYAYVCFGVGVLILVRATSRAERMARSQGWMMLVGSLVPATGNLAFLSALYGPQPDDPTPALVFVSAMIALYATVHFRVVDLSPLVAREALAALPDGMIVVDNQHHVAEINAEAARLLSTTQRHAVGAPLGALLIGTAAGAALRPLLANLDHAGTYNIGFEELAGARTIEARLRPLTVTNGAMAGAVLILRDVSERVRAEQAQAQHLAELNLIARVARAANTAADAKGLLQAVAETIAEAGIWQRVAVGLLTPGGEELSIAADIAAAGRPTIAKGQLLEGPAGEALLALLHEGRSRALDPADPALAGTPLGAAILREGLARLKIVPLYHQRVPLGLLALGGSAPAPASPGVMRVAETVGELITDAVVRAGLYDEAREADRIKALFLASVSHELRTPLTSIMGYVDMLRKGVYGPVDESMGEPLMYMRQSSQALLRMINDLLDFSRAEAGHLKVDLRPTDILGVAANVVGQLQPQIVERGLTFHFEVPPELPPVQGNPTRLEQVIANLLSNAIKFTEAGEVTIRAWRAGDTVCLSVQDSGIGIAPENQELIFQEFRRVETAGRRFGGTGLGLAISRRLLQLMGASIRVESVLGKGATFTIELPVAALPAERAQELERTVN